MIILRVVQNTCYPKFSFYHTILSECSCTHMWTWNTIQNYARTCTLSRINSKMVLGISANRSAHTQDKESTMDTIKVIASTSHIVDFYALESLRIKITGKYGHALDKLQDDIDETYLTLTDNLSHAFFDYLFHACMGEARHACNMGG